MNRAFILQVLQARRTTVLVLLVLLVVNVGLYLFVSLYQVPRLASLEQQVSEKRRLASGGVTQDAAAIYRQGKTDITAWRQRIAPKKEFARLVGDLFELAAGNSLKISGVTYRPSAIKEENLLAFVIDFTVNGKYGALKSFITDLGRSRDILYINSLALNNTKPTEEAINMRMQITALFRLEGQ